MSSQQLYQDLSLIFCISLKATNLTLAEWFLRRVLDLMTKGAWRLACWTPWQPLRSGWPGQALTLAQPSTNISTQPSTGASTSTTISTSTSTSYSTSTSKQKHQSAIQRGGLWRQASMGNDQVTLATGLVTVGPKSHFDFFGAAGSQFAATNGMSIFWDWSQCHWRPSLRTTVVAAIN